MLKVAAVGSVLLGGTTCAPSVKLKFLLNTDLNAAEADVTAETMSHNV